MSEQPVVVTFPGAVRVVDPGPKGTPPLKLRALVDTTDRLRGPKPKGTEVTVPPGFHLEYSFRDRRPSDAPTGKLTALVKVVKGSGGAQVTHAELEHVPANPEEPAKVIATSLTHEGVTGEGPTAALAVRNLHAKITARIAPPKEEDELPAETADKAPAPATTDRVERQGLTVAALEVSLRVTAPDFSAVDLTELAQAGYEGYAKQTGGLTFDGRKMPAWDELPPAIQGAWAAAASAIALSFIAFCEVKDD